MDERDIRYEIEHHVDQLRRDLQQEIDNMKREIERLHDRIRHLEAERELNAG